MLEVESTNEPISKIACLNPLSRPLVFEYRFEKGGEY